MSFQPGNIVFANTDFDAFADNDLSAKTANNAANTVKRSVVHIRSQQRNGRKSLTTIAGLATDLDLNKILKCMRKLFSTNGTILIDKADQSEVIQLLGDRRHDAADFLVKYKVCDKGEVKVHGA